MPAFLCMHCGVQYPNAEVPPAGCIVCMDPRRFATGTTPAWTTQAALRQTHFNVFRRLEQGLMGLGTTPAFALDQRAFLLRTAQGNILWDCLGFLDEATITIVTALGGIAGIAVSHPHAYGAMVEWSHAFGSVPVFVHAQDRKFLTRLDPVVHFWETEQYEITDGVTLLRCGGHFEGASVLHWAGGAGGRGALLASDVLAIGPDRMIGFMRSFPNLVPLDAASVQHIADVLAAWPFETIYGNRWDKVLTAGAKSVLAQSVLRHINAVTYPPTH